MKIAKKWVHINRNIYKYPVILPKTAQHSALPDVISWLHNYVGGPNLWHGEFILDQILTSNGVIDYSYKIKFTKQEHRTLFILRWA